VAGRGDYRSVFEFTASDAESPRAAARFHYHVDKYGELPILIAVLVTGTILTVSAWPLSWAAITGGCDDADLSPRLSPRGQNGASGANAAKWRDL
jgi:hypothetical protein